MGLQPPPWADVLQKWLGRTRVKDTIFGVKIGMAMGGAGSLGLKLV